MAYSVAAEGMVTGGKGPGALESAWLGSDGLVVCIAVL